MYIAATLLVLLLLGTAGVLHFGMTMDGGGKASPCPVVGNGAMCPMNPLEHITASQSAFTATLTQHRGLALLLIIFAVVLVVGLWRPLYTKRALQALRTWGYRLRKEFQVITPLQEAFSNGILNPKLF